MVQLVPEEFRSSLQQRVNVELDKLGYDTVYGEVSPGEDIAEVFIMARPNHAEIAKENLEKIAFAVRKEIYEEYTMSGGPVQGQPGSIHFTVKYPKKK